MLDLRMDLRHEQAIKPPQRAAFSSFGILYETSDRCAPQINDVVRSLPNLPKAANARSIASPSKVP